MKTDRPQQGSFGQAGTTLLELLIAIAILTIVIAGLLGLFSFCTAQNKKQGEIGTRTSEYCEDKMEQLLALQFSDTSSDTTTYPTAAAGGTGLGGTAASTTYGGININSPVTTPGTGYVDYLDEKGNLKGTAGYSTAFYIRVWQIQNNATATVKTITVVTSDLSSLSLGAGAPSTTLVSMKANF